jgi:hypothetical protein
MEYTPHEFVVRWKSTPVPWLVMVTVASGITAPVGSVTVPVIIPAVPCPKSVPVPINTKHTNPKKYLRVPCRMAFNIYYPLFWSRTELPCMEV